MAEWLAGCESQIERDERCAPADTFHTVLTDGRSVPADTVFVSDLCIIGAGPAGLAITQELIGSGLKILLIERGDVTYPPAAELVSVPDVRSPHFLFRPGTLRHQFGGMTSTWKKVLLDGARGARYLPMDPIDFERRYWVPYSGWPVTFDEMAPYYDRAGKLCGIEPFDFNGPLPENGRAPLSSPSGELVTRLEQFAPAAVFTSQPLAELTHSDQVHVVTNASAVEVTSAEGSEQGLATTFVRTPSSGSFSIRSRVVVLAGGAIENARLLLNSTRECTAGLGNQFDNVGRFFMEHPRIRIGYGSSPRPGAMDIYEPHTLGGQLVQGRLKLSEAVLRREGLLNGTAFLVSDPYLSTAQIYAWRSARKAMKSIKNRRNLRNVPRQLAMASRQAPSLAWLYLHRHLNLSEDADLGPNVGTGPVAKSFELVYQPEQAPNRVNRVTLSEARDSLGYPIAHLYWRWSEIDLLSIRRAKQIFASELRVSGLAESVDEQEGTYPLGEFVMIPPTSAHHHLGTTRMHDQPRQGVVDRVCRLHGSTSVYVAGASVFTTGGSANPTMTVVALAIRLADELRRRLSTCDRLSVFAADPAVT
jgi:choline dehydrogenase-like flavoprotein